ncbi:hypothetical protein [Kitasatospora brasiliensis]|uniref:hypothetical protein n=1 Tax=Kitasatospora brasiliensis TaxID=3058040 RepID=UPI00293014CF|nr:hypothetical protein [Kitasatospora sp. K002]
MRPEPRARRQVGGLLEAPGRCSTTTGPVPNVAVGYQELARSIAEGRRPHPDFHAAAAHHRVPAAIERSGRSGAAEKVR